MPPAETMQGMDNTGVSGSSASGAGTAAVPELLSAVRALHTYCAALLVAWSDVQQLGPLCSRTTRAMYHQLSVGKCAGQ